MRFRHQVIPPEQPPLNEEGDVLLSDDLAALGDRLRRDADLLAAQYPARSSDEHVRMQAAVPDEKPIAARRHRLATAAVAGLLLAVAAWPVMTRLAQPSLDTHRLTTESPSEPSPTTDVDDSSLSSTAHSVDVTNVDVQPADYHGERPAEGTPAVFLKNVSGPELEGLLDLWEQEQSAASSVSI